MLIEFSVENHRAFRERQTFSMVARRATDQTLQTGASCVPHVLPQACLFGANGAGKSSLIDAIVFMSKFVGDSFERKPGTGTGVKPFIFHSEWRSKPSEFEAIFLHEETLYQYGFSLTRERVVEEWLFARSNQTGRECQLFTRSYDESKDAYEWSINSTHLKGPRESWKEQTREDALFLSTAVHLNAQKLKEPHAWFVKQLKVMSLNRPSSYTLRRIKKDEWSPRVIELLKRVDISLVDIDIEESNLLESAEFLEMPAEIQKEIRANIPDDARQLTQLTAYTVRENEKGERVALKLKEESSGTKSLFRLAGPILDVLDNGRVLIVDELNSGLHPLAFQTLIALFSDPEINKKNAQLIFTTHDTSVTGESGCIGDDQIWIVDKASDLVAKLIPRSDFEADNGRSFQKGYLQGRYGGIPRIARWRWHHDTNAN